MTSYPDTVVDHRSSGKAPGKSNFSQTCTLLSHFLKEKRSSGASTLGIGGNNEHKGNTKDLISNLQNSDGALRLNASALDFLPQFVENPCIKKSNDRTTGPETPQLTILYAGKMLVFDAFPPEKATEIMELATKLASDNSSIKEIPPSVLITTEKLKGSKVPQTNTDSENPRPGNQVVGPDMRYPRRASLVKFLEKRKERVIAKGPYQINNPNPTRQEGSSSGCEPEDQCSKQLDLNL
ncbi:hypothetical protein Lal_00048512 [Lupinus albus]|uniref:Protein TIFY n=1 Tax=Lupinus albus TaxID=3870 RepID=A0A6A4QQR6_LUPAL|nr:putative transcription factor TIFY family [Lupinus albus]KAF1869229.1 hypothetical protein Lal_00048512 [Lupinus albus]